MAFKVSTATGTVYKAVTRLPWRQLGFHFLS